MILKQFIDYINQKAESNSTGHVLGNGPTPNPTPLWGFQNEMDAVINRLSSIKKGTRGFATSEVNSAAKEARVSRLKNWEFDVAVF